MDKRKICEFLVSKESGPGKLMAYKDYGAEGCAAIGPDGKKYVFDMEDLEKAAPEVKATAKAHAPKPQTKPLKAAEEKPEARRTPAKRQAATKPKAKKK